MFLLGAAPKDGAAGAAPKAVGAAVFPNREVVGVATDDPNTPVLGAAGEPNAEVAPNADGGHLLCC